MIYLANESTVTRLLLLWIMAPLLFDPGHVLLGEISSLEPYWFWIFSRFFKKVRKNLNLLGVSLLSQHRINHASNSYVPVAHHSFKSVQHCSLGFERSRITTDSYHHRIISSLALGARLKTNCSKIEFGKDLVSDFIPLLDFFCPLYNCRH